MEKIKKGDIVTRNSVNNDIFYYIENIIKQKNKSPIAMLKGLTYRIETMDYIENLKLVDRSIADDEIKKFENKINNSINEFSKYYQNNNRLFFNNEALILHLDGDKSYAQKSSMVYNKFGMNAIVKNIKESRQPYEIRYLLDRYNPDIVVITGHDGMIKKGYNYNDIYNYKNSKYFVMSVNEIRKWEQGINKISIFAGACQSYYEAIIQAGANFASSPARILIDFMDPIIIAQNIANTPESKYITIKDMQNELRDGERGVSGIGSFGQKK